MKKQDKYFIIKVCYLIRFQTRYFKIKLFALKSINFQTLFHPLIRVFFNFPSKYLFTIGVSYLFSFRSKYSPIFMQILQSTLLFFNFYYKLNNSKRIIKIKN